MVCLHLGGRKGDSAELSDKKLSQYSEKQRFADGASARPAPQHGKQPDGAECFHRQYLRLAGSQQPDDHAEFLCSHESGAEEKSGKCDR